MIYESDLDPECPVCGYKCGFDTWPAPRGVIGFNAALRHHRRVLGDPLSWWKEPEETTVMVEICPGSGQAPRILPRRKP